MLAWICALVLGGVGASKVGRWNWYLPEGVRRASRLAPERAH
jgi:hypothetical protein